MGRAHLEIELSPLLDSATAGGLEDRLRACEGVLVARVPRPGDRVLVQFDPRRTTVEALCERVRGTGLEARPIVSEPRVDRDSRTTCC
jgi:hypothetical protein